MPGVGRAGPFGVPGRAYESRTRDINVIRTPVGGTVTYSAISEFSGSFSADKAADGNSGTDWAASGVPAGAWWQVNWTDPQSISLVLLRDRPNGTDFFGSTGVLSFSDGSRVTYSGLPGNGGNLAIAFAARAVYWMRVTTDGGSGSNIGLEEVEAY